MELWKRDEVIFIVPVDVKNHLTDLVHMDCSVCEEGFGGVVARQRDPVVLVPDFVGCDRRMVTDLFADDLGCAVHSVRKLAEKHFTKDWIQRLTPLAIFAVVVLLLQGGEKPGEYRQCTFRGIRLL